MIIGVPKEIKEQENRVGLLPYTAKSLTRKGHTVLVQKNAGDGSGYPDEDYIEVGAKIVERAEDVFAQAEMIVKVKEPLKAEWGLLRKGQLGPASFHLPPSRGEQRAHRSSAQIRRYRRRLRDHSGRQQVTAPRADERDRRAHVNRDGCILPGET
jgi:alanine dehydrogenase